jgi:hypothetical protein
VAITDYQLFLIGNTAFPFLSFPFLSFDPSPCTKAKGFAAKAEFEESEGLGYSNKKVFDFLKNGGTFKLSTFSDYAQYMVCPKGEIYIY